MNEDVGLFGHGDPSAANTHTHVHTHSQTIMVRVCDIFSVVFIFKYSMEKMISLESIIIISSEMWA